MKEGQEFRISRVVDSQRRLYNREIFQFVSVNAEPGTTPGAPVPVDVPVRILQGREDPDVPWTHALELANAIRSDDVVFTLIKDGDHRLSRPRDIERLIGAVGEVA